MPLVFANLVRYSINGTYLGRPWVNVIDMVVDANGGSNTREADVEEVAGVVLGNFNDHVLDGLNTSVQFNSVSWVDLTALDGSTGNITGANGTNLPQVGTEGGTPYAASVSMLVTKQTVSARGQRQGRWYLVGATEQNVEGNMFTDSHVDDMNTALSLCLEGLTETADLAAPQYYPVVSHTSNHGTTEHPVYEVDAVTQIHDFIPQKQIASQRRRNRP